MAIRLNWVEGGQFMSEEKRTFNACPTGTYCGACPLTTIVRDGKVVRTERTRFTGTEKDLGFICQKGIAAARYPYLPDRILHPLKRTGKRGEGKWEEISWDQALDEIAAKLLEIKGQYGPQAVATWSWSGGPGMGLNTILAYRFNHVFGASDTFAKVGVDNASNFAWLMDMGAGPALGWFDPLTIDHTNYILAWGCNPIENQPRVGRYLAHAKARGIRIVDFGLVFDGTAGFADEFHFVKAGTDAAVALAMANVIVGEGLYDSEYLVKYTVAPLLVREDNGLYLRDTDGNYLAWDESAGAAVSVAQGEPIPVVTPALRGTFEVNGTTCSPAFEKLVQHLTDYTPESQEPITGIAADDVRRIAIEYATAKPALIVSALGMRYYNAGRTYRTVFLLSELTGNVGCAGGGVTGTGGIPNSLPPIGLNNVDILYPDGPENAKSRVLPAPDFFRAVKTGTPTLSKHCSLWVGTPFTTTPAAGAGSTRSSRTWTLSSTTTSG